MWGAGSMDWGGWDDWAAADGARKSVVKARIGNGLPRRILEDMFVRLTVSRCLGRRRIL